MIGTKLLKGQGLGNQLLAYVSARCLAEDCGCEFGLAGSDLMAMNIHNSRGMYFMDMDLGGKMDEDNCVIYNEKEERLFLGNSVHDMTHGVYVAGADEKLVSHDLQDNTIVMGNLQAEAYFAGHLAEIREWLKVKPEYDSMEYSRSNLCIINLRGGEYTGKPELYIDRKYWINAIGKMKEIRPDMKFMIVTDDVEAAGKILPGIEAHHFDIAGDYTTIKNAHYLILSNSSFAILPAYTSETLEYAIAPKYWARHNVSDGYWASEQNIYSLFHYMDRKGRIFSADECREQFGEYRKKDSKFRTCTAPASGTAKIIQELSRKRILAAFWIERIVSSLKRRAGSFF